MKVHFLFKKFLRLSRRIRFLLNNAIRPVLDGRVSSEVTKVKLVAIAKDEATYIPEWIFHHLYFGFDEICIYVNNSRDLSNELSSIFGNCQSITFKDGDPFFRKNGNEAQINIYRNELKISKKEGFSHVMFLDIDEFWTPRELDTGIKEFVVKNPNADVISFEWFNRTIEGEAFSAALSREVTGYCGHHVKSLVRTRNQYYEMNPHVPIADHMHYILADGTEYKFERSSAGLVSKAQQMSPLKSAFIIHRMIRSQEEYVALLARGRPHKQNTDSPVFKNNRDGYVSSKGNVTVTFPNSQLLNYLDAKTLFFEKYSLDKYLKRARQYVFKKRLEVLKMIVEAPSSEAKTLEKVLKHVTLQDVVEAYIEFKEKHGLN